MENITLYHYVSEKKYQQIQKDKFIKPSAPFNSKILDKKWDEYVKRFSFPLARLYTCTFFEPEPKAWQEYGLFDLLMEEFAGGDLLLKISVEDNSTHPIIIRDHRFHSPKEYGYPPEIWKKREIRNSKPNLRKKWYESVVPIQEYDGNYICPEILIPFKIPLDNVIQLP